MDKPLVSVVITTHNRIDLLKKAIESVQNQSYKNIELVVVNDNSSDETPQYLEELCKNCKNIKHIDISQKESQGGNYARNQGVLKTIGNYVAFLDDDDEWMSSKIEKQIDFLRHNPEYGMVYCGRRVEKNFLELEDILQDKDLRGDLSEKCFERVFCLTSMLLIRREILFDVGLFDESLKAWQEYDLCIRIANKTKIGCIDEPLILYRIIEKDINRNTNNLNGWQESVTKMSEKYADRLSQCRESTKMLWKLNILYDGANRAENAGLRREQRHYLFEIYKITHKLKHFVRCILNTNLSAEMYFKKIILKK